MARAARLAAGFFALAAINFARNPDLFLHPPLPLDDALLLQHYYNGLAGGALFYYATTLRYVAVLPQLTGFLSVHALDVRWVPAAFSLSSLALLSGAYLLFATRLFEPLFPRPELRRGLALLLALLPAGAYALVAEAVFQSWTCLLVAIALSVVPAQRGAGARAGALLLGAVCLWSSPASPVALPILGVRSWRAWRRVDAREFEYAGLLLLAGALYAGLGLHPESWSRLLRGAADGLAAGSGGALAAAAGLAFESAVYTLDRVVTEALLGYRFRTFLLDRELGWLSPCIGLAGVALAVRELRRSHGGDPAATRLALQLGYAILALSLLAFAARPHVPEVLRLERAFRYCYVQKYLWVVLLVFLAQPRLEALRRVGARRARAAAGAAVLLYAGLLSVLNTAPYRTGLLSRRVEDGVARGTLRPPEELDGRRLRAFLGEVRRAERSLPPGERREMAQPRRGYALRLWVQRRD